MFTEGLQYQVTIKMITVECCNCGVVFGMPSDLNQRFRNDPDEYFYCPKGHRQHYSESAIEKRLSRANELRDEAERIAAKAIEDKRQLEDQLKQEQKTITRMKKGVCPCCTRSFVNLKRHMETKHPEELGKTKVTQAQKKTKAK